MLEQSGSIHETLLDISETLKHIDYNLNLLREMKHGETVKEAVEQYDTEDIRKALEHLDDGPPFKIPTLEEARQYAESHGMAYPPEEFIDHYTKLGWRGVNGQYLATWESGYNGMNSSYLQQKRAKDTKRIARPSSFSEVYEYFKEKGRPEYAEDFWGYYEPRTWKTASGKKINNWKKAADAWIRRNQEGFKEVKK